MFADADGDGDRDVILSRPTAMQGFDKAINTIQGGWLENQGDSFVLRPYSYPSRVKRLRY